MIGGLRPYPAYKDCGVPWLGNVPSHWNVSPAFAAYRPKLTKNTGLVEKTVLSLSYGRIVIKPEEKLHGLVPESFESYQIVEPGNIIIRTTDLQNDKTSLRVGRSSNRGIITSAYLCLETTDRVSSEFGYQYLNTCDLLKIIYAFGSGLRQNLDFSEIKRLPVLVPPPSEQAAIVRFLDHADRQIRRYIRAKQKLIALLKEQKQALIQRAVTRGLDPNVRLRPSGVEWLGDVPENWQIVPLKRGCELIRDGTHLPPPRVPSGIPLLSVRNIVNEELIRRADDSFILESDYDALSKSFAPRKGDVLLAIVGATLGKVAIVGDMGRFQIQRSLALLRPHEETLISEFLADYLRSSNFQSALWQTVAFSAQPGIYLNTISNFPFVCPPKDEQSKIVSYLRRRLVPLVDAISVNSRQIELVREHRVRLLADVVTGKVDVREEAAGLPEEPAEAESLEQIELSEEAEKRQSETEAEEADA